MTVNASNLFSGISTTCPKLANRARTRLRSASGSVRGKCNRCQGSPTAANRTWHGAGPAHRTVQQTPQYSKWHTRCQADCEQRMVDFLSARRRSATESGRTAISSKSACRTALFRSGSTAIAYVFSSWRSLPGCDHGLRSDIGLRQSQSRQHRRCDSSAAEEDDIHGISAQTSSAADSRVSTSPSCARSR